MGLAKMKRSAGGAPTKDVAIALEVIATVCQQHQEMLEQFRPKAVAFGAR